MRLDGLSALSLGVEERSDEAPSERASAPPARPDPEVVAKPKRRRFTAAYRLRILEAADRCTEPGEVGRLLRREGLYRCYGAGGEDKARSSLTQPMECPPCRMRTT